MKIVINRCFGGFGLSAQALTRLYDLGSIAVGTAPKDVDSGSSIDSEYPLTPDRKSFIFPETFYTKIRTCPHLVKVVEELGEAANGRFSELAVIEIPDDISWYIDEDKGMETIHEEHRTWN